MDLLRQGRHAIVGAFMLATPLITSAQSTTDNTLRKAEIKDGWQLLFDGTSTKGWHAYNGSEVGGKWKAVEGTLMLDPASDASGGDIVTDKAYANYELQLDWKIEPCGNSGIIFNVVESAANAQTYYTGPEIQVLDNCHPDGKISKHRAGNLYDLISSKRESVKPGDQWNHYRIVSRNGKLQVWLNDVEQFQTQMFTPEWEAMIKGSKFKDMPDFGKAHAGKIALQDHGNRVAYKNIKLKEL